MSKKQTRVEKPAEHGGSDWDTVRKVATDHNVSEQFVRRAIARGDLKAKRFVGPTGSRGVIRIHKSATRAWTQQFPDVC